MKILQNLIQKIKCAMPFSLNQFWHKNVIVTKKLAPNTDLVECLDCGKKFVLNHAVEMILPWEDVKSIYEGPTKITK